jgi:bifunctional DNA-binding transcriptional regulator/antitoxin component of YhaV-PrlF toxin-antitoxin module
MEAPAQPYGRFTALLLYGCYRTPVSSSFISLQNRGTIALPADVRRRLGLDVPGAQVEVIVREDNVIELHPCVPVAASQTWFWSREWQEQEQQVDAEVRAGKVTTHDSVDALLGHLDTLDGE